MTISVGRVGPARTIWWWWLSLTAVAVAVFAPLPYLKDSLAGLSQGGSQLAANYVDRPTLIQVALYAHIVGGGLALLLSALQFVARLRRQRPAVHRLIGRIVLVSIIVAGVAGAVLSTTNLAGPVGTAGFGLLAVLWVSFAGLAWFAIRRRDIAAHRRWVVRAFALTYAAVTLRLWLALLIAPQVANGISENMAFDRAYAIVPFLCWVPNLLVAEVVIRRIGRQSEPSRG